MYTFNEERICDYVRFEVFTAVTMKNGVFWVVTPCGSCKNRRFGGTQRLLHQVTRIGELRTTLAITSNRCMLRSVRQLLVTATFLVHRSLSP
jgi:hypothetical protein